MCVGRRLYRHSGEGRIFVIPAEAGIQGISTAVLDPGLRRGDDEGRRGDDEGAGMTRVVGRFWHFSRGMAC